MQSECIALLPDLWEYGKLLISNRGEFYDFIAG